jgi:hypothetical protein
MPNDAHRCHHEEILKRHAEMRRKTIVEKKRINCKIIETGAGIVS